MKIQVLGCSGAEFPGHRTSAFLIDNAILLDAGTIGTALKEDEQLSLKYIFITHPHLDHIKGIPLLADNLTLMKHMHNVKLLSTKEVLRAIRDHLLNDIIWPDFSTLPSKRSPVLSYVEIAPESELHFDGYTITAYPMNHPVPAVGYILKKGNKSLLYTGDTGPTDLIWEKAGDVSALIVEVSMPNKMKEMAIATGHLTPDLMALELRKLKKLPQRILITHLKPQFSEQIKIELDNLLIDGISILTEGAVYIL